MLKNAQLEGFKAEEGEIDAPAASFSPPKEAVLVNAITVQHRHDSFLEAKKLARRQEILKRLDQQQQEAGYHDWTCRDVRKSPFLPLVVGGGLAKLSCMIRRRMVQFVVAALVISTIAILSF